MRTQRRLFYSSILHPSTELDSRAIYERLTFHTLQTFLALTASRMSSMNQSALMK